MFRKSNVELDLAGLDDFMEKPSQDCNEDELKKGVNKVVTVLSKNPVAIIQVISSHPFIAATFLLDDLAEKMKKQNCLDKIGILFDKCLDDLVEACIYNSYDLERCLKIMPVYSEKVIHNILSQEHLVKRLLNGNNNPEETLNEIVEKYPNCRNRLYEFYSQHFNAASKKAGLT